MLLYEPRMMGEDESEAVGECELAGDTAVLGENLPQFHPVHLKFQLDSKSAHPSGKPATNSLSYITASPLYLFLSLFLIPLASYPRPTGIRAFNFPCRTINGSGLATLCVVTSTE
jgi:hypothetical protein